MIPIRRRQQLFICFDCSHTVRVMATSTSKIQTQLRVGRRTVFRKLRNLGGINGNHVRPNIALVHDRICHSILDKVRHMTIYTINAQPCMDTNVLHLRLIKMAIPTASQSSSFFGVIKLYHARMRVMAHNAINNCVLALEKIAIGVLMLNETIRNHQFLSRATRMTITASARGAIYFHLKR
ncbi:MAG: hypothetical protein IPJ94_25010 [Chloroflexi bacterium]|nr:hypothetical protein [Chloroflexota bacterium]